MLQETLCATAQFDYIGVRFQMMTTDRCNNVSLGLESIRIQRLSCTVQAIQWQNHLRKLGIRLGTGVRMSLFARSAS